MEINIAHISTTAWVCTALLAFLIPALGFYVSLQRGSAKTNYHFNPDPTDPLYKAVRMHGNSAEYIPTLIILILATNYVVPGQVSIWLAILVTVSRYCYPIGIWLSESMDKAHVLRIVGSAGAYFLGMGQAGWLLYGALAG